MDMHHLFCLQNVEVGIYIPAIMRYKYETYLMLENTSIEMESCFICSFLLVFCRLLQKLQSETRA